MQAELQRARGPMGHAIFEAVSCFAAPDVCDRIIDGALAMSPWTAIPEGPEDARAFIEGALRMALVHYLGEHTAEAVVNDLEAVQAVYAGRAPVAIVSPATVAPPSGAPDFDDEEQTARADTHVRARDPHRMPRLFVVSPRLDAAEIMESFGGAVTCVRTFDLEQTINSLRVLEGSEAVVLLDGALAVGRAETVVEQFEPYKSKVFVVLWDAPGTDAWEMERICTAAGWAYLPEEANSAQVNEFLARLIH